MIRLRVALVVTSGPVTSSRYAARTSSRVGSAAACWLATVTLAARSMLTCDTTHNACIPGSVPKTNSKRVPGVRLVAVPARLTSPIRGSCAGSIWMCCRIRTCRSFHDQRASRSVEDSNDCASCPGAGTLWARAPRVMVAVVSPPDGSLSSVYDRNVSAATPGRGS